MQRSRGAIVGAFVVGGFLLFAVGLFLIGDRRMLFADRFEVTTTFGKVTGLVVGTTVRLAGLNVGEVLEITVPARPSDPFVVRMRIREDVHSLVRTDSVCAIQTDGIVGNAFVQISPGSDDAPIVQADGRLPGIDPIEFADLITQGRDTFQQVSDELIKVSGSVTAMVDSATETVDTTRQIVARQSDAVDRIVASAARTSDDVQQTVGDVRSIVDGVRRGEGTVGRLLTDTTFYDQMTGIGSEAQRTARAVRETAEDARDAVRDFTGPDGTGPHFAASLGSTLARVDEVTSDLAENTEALKRNFLFSGFFKDRGFFDLDAISRDAYQRGLLERDRTAVRVWLDGALLFETNTDGQEALTSEGRRRIDTAMAQLVRYPRNSPLVVEGYAQPSAADTEYLLSLDRAELVRDYVMDRFRRDQALTVVMPLGSEAAGSPSSDGHWAGVALTMFVSNDALRPERK